jgi:putative membrane protein
MSKERILREATFSPRAVPYHVVPAVVLLVATIAGIPVALVIGPLLYVYRKLQYQRLRVILTSRDLKVNRGVLNREEKTIPLEKITDLAVFQGPIMRLFGVKGIRVETAGQSSMGGALVTVVGIENTDDFRDLVLNQRDRITDGDDGVGAASPGARAAAPASASADGGELRALHDIRDALGRIETLLRERS